MQKISPRLYSRIAMMLVLFLGWYLFITNLETRSIWYDEPSTYAAFNAGFSGYLKWAAGNVHAPFYFTYILLWQAFVGTQHLTIMRISSVLPAMLALAMSYRIGVDWLRNQWVGIGAAAFLATSGLYVHYATDFRMYPLLIFLVALNWWALWRLLTQRRGGFWLYVALLTLLAYTHYFAVFSLLPQIIVVGLYYRHRLKPVILAGLLTLALFSPWLPTAINQITIAQEQGATTNVVGKTLGTEPTSAESVLNLMERYTASKPAYIALLLFLSLNLYPQLQGKQRAWYLAAWVWYFVPLLIMFSVNPTVRVYALRYTLPIFTGLALLTGMAIATFQRQSIRIAGLLLLIVINLMTLKSGFVYISTEPPHRTLIQYVDDRFQAGDLVWYNMDDGALGSSQAGVEIHMRYETEHVTLDTFVWDAPYDFEDTTSVPRVWHVRPYWLVAPDFAAEVLNAGRVITDTITYEAYVINLFEAAPISSPAIFAEQFEIRVSPVNEPDINAGDSVQINTWWDVNTAPELDYSYTLLLTPAADENTILWQQDAALLSRPEILDIDNQLATNNWLPDAQPYFAPLFIELPEDLAAGDYEIWLGLYYWEDGELLPITANGIYTLHESRALIKLADLSF